MKTTERFGLSLWELGDLIRMEDFNQNHQKIEEALEQLSQGGFQLYHGSAGGDSSLEFQIGLKKMGGWEDWNLLGLLLLAPDYEKRSGYSSCCWPPTMRNGPVTATSTRWGLGPGSASRPPALTGCISSRRERALASPSRACSSPPTWCVSSRGPRPSSRLPPWPAAGPPRASLPDRLNIF